MNQLPDTETRKRSKRVAVKWAALLGVVGGIAVLLASTIVHPSSSVLAKPVDTTTCTTCMSVAGPSANPVLYPGATPSSLPVTFTNTTNGPIYVTSLKVGFTNAFPTGCPASNFMVKDSTAGAMAAASADATTTTITYSPAQTIPAGQTWTDNATLSMPDSGKQDACQGLPIAISYTGTANYTVMTTASMQVAPNAGTDSETLSATIAPDIQPASAAHSPGPGDGTVTFYSCTDATSISCANALGTAQVGAGGVATYNMSASAIGSYKVEAVYFPADRTSFVTSTSPIITEDLSGCVAAPTSTAGTIITGTISGNYTVPSGASVWLNNGTINGNVTVLGNGSFAATGGTVNGSITSSGGPIAIAGTTVTGNVQNTNGGLSLGPSTLIKGNAQATGSGVFCSEGASGTQAQVSVRGNLQVQNLTGTTPATACATTVGNNLLWQNNAVPSFIGLSCGGNTILGNMNVQNNSGKLTIGDAVNAAGNKVSGNTNVNGNTGGGTLINTSSAGTCTLSGDKPGIAGTSNTAAKGNNQCNTTSTGA